MKLLSSNVVAVVVLFLVVTDPSEASPPQYHRTAVGNGFNAKAFMHPYPQHNHPQSQNHHPSPQHHGPPKNARQPGPGHPTYLSGVIQGGQNGETPPVRHYTVQEVAQMISRRLLSRRPLPSEEDKMESEQNERSLNEMRRVNMRKNEILDRANAMQADFRRRREEAIREQAAQQSYGHQQGQPAPGHYWESSGHLTQHQQAQYRPHQQVVHHPHPHPQGRPLKVPIPHAPPPHGIIGHQDAPRPFAQSHYAPQTFHQQQHLGQVQPGEAGHSAPLQDQNVGQAQPGIVHPEPPQTQYQGPVHHQPQQTQLSRPPQSQPIEHSAAMMSPQQELSQIQPVVTYVGYPQPKHPPQQDQPQDVEG